MHLYEAAKDTIGLGKPAERKRSNFQQPLPLLIQAFSTYAPEISEPEAFFFQIVPYCTKMRVEKGTVLWKEGDDATCFFLIEVGALKLIRNMYDLGHSIVETMLPARCVTIIFVIADFSKSTQVLREKCRSYQKLDGHRL